MFSFTSVKYIKCTRNADKICASICWCIWRFIMPFTSLASGSQMILWEFPTLQALHIDSSFQHIVPDPKTAFSLLASACWYANECTWRVSITRNGRINLLAIDSEKMPSFAMPKFAPLESQWLLCGVVRRMIRASMPDKGI